jgi:polar amino acid transport system substrate-binding protein
MKKLISALIIVSLHLISMPAHARKFTDIKKSGVLRVAVDGNTPGLNFYSKGQLTGFEVDLAQAIANGLGLKIEWTIQPFNTLLIGLREDRFDLIADSHTITEQRAELVDFVTPHYCSGANIITKIGGPTTAALLQDKVVAVAVGTVYADKLKTIPGIKNIITLPGESDGFMALMNDRADAWVTERSIALGAINSSTSKNLLVIGDQILSQVNAMAIAKGNSDLQAAVDKQMHQLMQDGTYDKLMRQYVGEDISCPR